MTLAFRSLQHRREIETYTNNDPMYKQTGLGNYSQVRKKQKCIF